MRESSKQGTRAAFADIFQGKEEDPTSVPEASTKPTANEGKKKRKALEESSQQDVPEDMNHEPVSISSLELDGTMAQLGFNISKFPHNKKTRPGMSQPKMTSFEPEEGQIVKKDEIDALFKKEKNLERGKSKKGKKLEKMKDNVQIDVLVGDSMMDDSLKAVMGALEGGSRKSRKKGIGSGKKKIQNVML